MGFGRPKDLKDGGGVIDLQICHERTGGRIFRGGGETIETRRLIENNLEFVSKSVSIVQFFSRH